MIVCVFFPAQDVRAFPSTASTSTSSQESQRLEVGARDLELNPTQLFIAAALPFSIIYHVAAAETLLLSLAGR